MCCFFFKQKTAYELRISDWSSDVCSSDLAYSRVMRTGALPDASVRRVFGEAIALLDRLGHTVADAELPFEGPAAMEQIGSASCRERGCSYALISVVAVILKTIKHSNIPKPRHTPHGDG